MAEKVRIGSPADEPEILRLLQLMHAEGGMFDLDEGCAREMFARAFNRKGGIIGLIGPMSDIRGMIYLLITRAWYTKQNHLEELFCYVRPDCRKSNYASDLITFAQNCSDEIGIPLSIGVLTNIQTAEKVRLYRRKLGYPAGAFFVHGARWVNKQPGNEDFWRAPFTERGKAKRANGLDKTSPAIQSA